MADALPEAEPHGILALGSHALAVLLRSCPPGTSAASSAVILNQATAKDVFFVSGDSGQSWWVPKG
eukprot:10976732-Alexandrium_andersonii.AAC.1